MPSANHGHGLPAVAGDHGDTEASCREQQSSSSSSRRGNKGCPLRTTAAQKVTWLEQEKVFHARLQHILTFSIIAGFGLPPMAASQKPIESPDLFFSQPLTLALFFFPVIIMSFLYRRRRLPRRAAGLSSSRRHVSREFSHHCLGKNINKYKYYVKRYLYSCTLTAWSSTQTGGSDHTTHHLLVSCRHISTNSRVRTKI